MANTEPPITLDEQIIQMKKYVSFRQRKKMREFVNYAGYFRASRYGKFLLSRVGVTGAKSKQDTLFALYKFDVEHFIWISSHILLHKVKKMLRKESKI